MKKNKIIPPPFSLLEKNEKKKCFLLFIFLFSFTFISAQTATENYIKTTDCLDENCVKKAETVQYLDYLGRPKQIVNVKASPEQKDIVTPIVYDELGRQTRNYLPVPQSSSSNGNIYPQGSGLIPYPVVDATGFYAGEKIYTEKTLEQSPLERVLQQKQVGSAWDTKPITFGYDVNTVADHVKKYTVAVTWNAAEKLYINQVQPILEYGPAQLMKNSVTDEDGNISVEFKDGKGQTILIRKMLNATESADTYYVYNDYGHLALVVPPLASGKPELDLVTLDTLCYQYTYDSKNRLAEKKNPGKGKEYRVYDKQDRLVLVQDAMLGAANNNFGSKGWLFTKYDPFGRTVYMGFFANTASRVAMQTALNNMVMNSANNESRDDSSPIVQNSVNIGYSKNAFPTGSMTILSVNYYDTYPPLPSGVSVPTSIMNQEVLQQIQGTSAKSTKSIPLASYVKNIEDNSWTKTFNYYSTKGEIIGSHTLNHLGGYTQTETEMDFAGAVKQSIVRHKRLATDAERIITQTFEYDHQNRLKVQKHQVDNGPVEILAQHSYDELSQLKNKKTGGTVISEPDQSTDYAYNIRGWMTQINDPANLNGKLFGMKIKYQNPEDPDYGKPRYNGNISEIDWKTTDVGDKIYRRYSYTYDRLNRLTDGIYLTPFVTSNSQNHFYDEKLTYDINGNIKTLLRFTRGPSGSGTAMKMDELVYDYASGNRLNTVKDEGGNSSGYPLGGNVIGYDLNGNMTSSLDKGITAIRYNYLDLPKEILSPQGNTSYIYRADGSKVKKIFGTTTTDYLDGFQYENGVLKFFPVSGGFYNTERNEYVYQFTDHLGNVRLSYSAAKGGGIAVLEESNYYPFGLKHQGYNEGSLLTENGTHYTYQYNGKELQETGMYDYGARFYMPDLGRWGVMDAMSEKYTSHSPYNYALNNPVMFIDPDGNEVLSGLAAQQAFTEFKANMSSSSGNTYFTGLDFSQFGGDPPGKSYLGRAIDWLFGRNKKQSNMIEVGPAKRIPFEEKKDNTWLVISSLLFGNVDPYSAIGNAGVGPYAEERENVGIAAMILVNPEAAAEGLERKALSRAAMSKIWGKGSKIDPQNLPKVVTSEFTEILAGRGMPQLNEFGAQAITQNRSGIRSGWVGALEWKIKDVPGTSLNGSRIVQHPSGKWGLVIDHNYKTIIKIPTSSAVK